MRKVGEEGVCSAALVLQLLLCFSIARLLERRQERLQPGAIAGHCQFHRCFPESLPRAATSGWVMF